MNNNIEYVELHTRMKESYMSYAIATIVDRAIPDVRDGCLPIHRRILYAMFNRGLTHDKPYAKSSEPVSETLKIHNHGDSSAYGSLALLTDRNETLLHPFLDGDGSFGKVYSTDSPSHMRYTFCRLNKFSEEMFQGLKQGAVKIVGEDGHYQPIVLPNTYPNILVKPNSAIAVGEACNWGSFPLSEVCDVTIAYIKNKDIEVIDYLTPDFSTGGQLIYDRLQLESIYKDGRGSIRLRSKYRYIEEENLIEIYEIPYSTTAQKVIKEITEKMDKYKDITDVRDETGFNKEKNIEELKITIDVKKNTNTSVLMAKLLKDTSLETNFSFNMNCLVNNSPKVLGIKPILDYWIKFREECIINTMNYDLNKKKVNLHLLLGLKQVLLDIDKAIEIIRFSKDTINNLIKYFSIDEKQAINVIENKLKNINEDYIIKQIKDIEQLQKEVKTLEYNINDENYIINIIVSDLERVREQYKLSRKTEIIYEDNIQQISQQDLIQDYNCRIFYTNNYIKKHLKQSDNHKYKEDNIILGDITTTNKSTLLIFTNQSNRFRIQCSELEQYLPSVYGSYIPNLINLQPNEEIIKIISVEKPTGYMVFAFENGKVAKIKIDKFLSSYQKLENVYSTESKLLDLYYSEKDIDILMVSDEGKAIIFNSSEVNAVSSKNSQGSVGMKLDNNIIIGSIINVAKDISFELITLKEKQKEFILSDISPTNKANEERDLYTYLFKRRANQGNFLINTRVNNDKIISVKLI